MIDTHAGLPLAGSTSVPVKADSHGNMAPSNPFNLALARASGNLCVDVKGVNKDESKSAVGYPHGKAAVQDTTTKKTGKGSKWTCLTKQCVLLCILYDVTYIPINSILQDSTSDLRMKY